MLQLVVGEAVLVSLLGGVAGLLLGAAAAKALSAAGPMGGLVKMDWRVVAGVLGVAAVVGLLSSVAPALIVSRKNVVESLRSTT